MTTNENLEALYGPLAAYSEYQKGASLTYRVDGQTHTGVIVWIVGPTASPRGCSRPTQYVVERDNAPGAMPDVICPSDIIER